MGLFLVAEPGGEIWTSAFDFFYFLTELVFDLSYRDPLVPDVCRLSVYLDRKSRAGSCYFSVIFLCPKAPSKVELFFLCEYGEAGVPTVKNVGFPVPGKNECEFNP